jgi:cystathionine gamma-synthase
MRIETLLVHSGAEPDQATGAVAPPLHLSTTFVHGPAAESLHGYLYIREGNPNLAQLESALAEVEGGQVAFAFASGMAASTACLQSLPPDSHVLLHHDVYAGTRRLGLDFFSRWGGEATVVDMSDLAAVEKALRRNTRLLWVETPSNPLLTIVDIAPVAELAHRAGARVLVDGTFCTPALQRPIESGADIVLHSTTKYIGGHSDVQGGALVFRRKDAASDAVHQIQHVLGAVCAPFNCWLVLRGLRTLACRMERHSATAHLIAAALAAHPRVARVHYPGLASHPNHQIARRQMRAFGGMLSFQVKGGRDAAVAVASRVRLFLNATSLGGVESLIEHRASSEGAGSQSPEDLLRVSVGLEHPDDLITDLMQALG